MEQHSMNQEQLLSRLRHLRLASFAEALSQQWLKPIVQDLSFEERLDLLLSYEMTARESSKIKRLVQRASLRQEARGEEINYAAARGINKAEISTLLRCDFLAQRQNILITGATGCGKSYLACAIGRQACHLKFSVLYVRLPRFMEEMTMSHLDGSFPKLLNQLLRVDLLILDDFALTPINSEQRQDLFNIIEDRHQLRSTLVTSQLPVKHWHEYLGEPTLADAILDRLLENANRIELKGHSLRKNSKKEVENEQKTI
jgi:DNA replication protein DnaC